ncbi:MAG: PilZ domain-containing protein, partial [Myxococcota bacterium]
LDGASLRSEVRPAIGSHVVVSLRNALGTGQPVTVTGEVVRNTPDGFAILFADASHRSRRYVDSLRARLAPRDPTPYYNRVRPRPITR